MIEQFGLMGHRGRNAQRNAGTTQWKQLAARRQLTAAKQ
jgi:hypothetical protein